MKLGDLEIDLIIKAVDAKRGADEAKKSLTEVEKSAKGASTELEKVGQSGKAAGAGLNLTSIAATAASAALLYFVNNSVKMGAELINLQGAFQGTKEDMDLFRKATAGTLSDASLLKLSNEATDLGVSLKDQALAFSLAEERADKYGGTIESNFMAVIAASDGMERGLRSVGVSVQDYNNELAKLESSMGRKLEQMDTEEARSIRLQAVYNLTGTTLETVNAKTADAADVLGQLQVVAEQTAASFGVGLIKAFAEASGGAQSLTGDIQVLSEQAQGAGETVSNFVQLLIQLGEWAQDASFWLSPVSTAIFGVSSAAQDAYYWVKNLLNLGGTTGIGDAFNTGGWQTPTETRTGTGSEYGPGNQAGKMDFLKNNKPGSTNTGSRSATKKKEQEDDLTYLARLKKELAEIQAIMQKQTDTENIFSGLLEKEDEIQRTIWLLEHWKEVMSAPLPSAADLPGEKTGITPYAVDEMTRFMISLQEARKERQESAATYSRIVTDLQAAVTLAGQMSNALKGGGQEFMNYLQMALAFAMQIAQVTGKGAKGESIGISDILGIVGTFLPFLGFLGFSSGGRVPGSGAGDSVPAMLEPGEFVIRKSRASAIGSQMLSWLNGGGPVMPQARQTAMSTGGSLVINFSGEMTPEMKYKIVDAGSRFKNVRVQNSTY